MRSGLLKVVKLGGSVITVKDIRWSIRREVLLRLLRELGAYQEEFPENRVVLIHGGGSYGHPLVKDCVTRYGRITESCYMLTADSMDTLNAVVRKYSISVARIPAVSLSPRAICSIFSGNPHCKLDAVASVLEKGLTPVLYGDVVISDKGFEVLSGDTLAWYIARELNAFEILFVTDVDGLYEEDPKVDPNARKIVEALADEVIDHVSASSSSVDVTGGMTRKLIEGKLLGVRGVKVKIVGGFIEGNLYSALKSDNFVGSIVWY